MLERLRSALADLPWMVIGGMAVVSRGVARTTRDLDLAVSGAAAPIEHVLRALEGAGLEARVEDAVSFAARTHVLLVRDVATGLDVDVTLAWAPFEEQALASADTVEVAGAAVPVARAEDLVIYKLVGGRPVDLADVEELVALHREAMDLDRVGELVRQIAEVLEDPARVTAWERILRESSSGRPSPG